MNNNKTTILIADDHELVRKGIISLLIEEQNLQVVAEANNGKDLVYKYLKFKPDLIISDISMPELSGFEAITTLSDNNKNIKVLFLSMFAGDDYIYHCIKAGGCGLISKDSPKEELLFAIELISKGKRYFGKALPEEKIFQFVKDYEKNLSKEKITKKTDFTEQEISVLLLVAEGQTSSDIADKLFISKRTVDSHRANIIHKLGLKTGPQLLKYAIKFSEEYKMKTP
jgi:DNA-binding NarL/FixJ family response regulator